MWYDYDDDCRHDDFEGTYAHDVAGYDDDTIYDAFEGDPDAYWNIDQKKTTHLWEYTWVSCTKNIYALGYIGIITITY